MDAKVIHLADRRARDIAARLVAVRAQARDGILSSEPERKQDLVSLLSSLHDTEVKLVEELCGLLWRVRDENLRLCALVLCNCHRRWLQSPLHGTDETVHGDAYLDALMRFWELAC